MGHVHVQSRPGMRRRVWPKAPGCGGIPGIWRYHRDVAGCGQPKLVHTDIPHHSHLICSHRALHEQLFHSTCTAQLSPTAYGQSPIRVAPPSARSVVRFSFVVNFSTRQCSQTFRFDFNKENMRKRKWGYLRSLGESCRA